MIDVTLIGGNELRGKVTIVEADITDLAALQKICEDSKIEKIIHTAALLDSKNPPLTTSVNCQGSINILEVALRLGIKRVAISSSVSVFGTPDMYEEEYIPNNANHYPASVYAASKAFLEVAVKDYYKRGVDAIVVRFSHVFGYGRLNGMGTAIDEGLIGNPARGLPGSVPYGEDTHNWIYVKDAARSLIVAANVEKTENRCFTVGGDVAAFEY